MINSFLGFKGRIGRGTWWIGTLLVIALLVALPVLLSLASSLGSELIWTRLSLSVAIFVASLLALAISISTTVKRYHDRDKSGWWFFLGLIPIAGSIWQIVELGFCSGSEGDNRFGPPPGSGDSLASSGNKVTGVPRISKGSLDRIDDNYLADYARKIALEQNNSKTYTTGSFGQNTSARPVFGKR